jgi:hypothetical protein
MNEQTHAWVVPLGMSHLKILTPIKFQNNIRFTQGKLFISHFMLKYYSSNKKKFSFNWILKIIILIFQMGDVGKSF